MKEKDKHLKNQERNNRQKREKEKEAGIKGTPARRQYALPLPSPYIPSHKPKKKCPRLTPGRRRRPVLQHRLNRSPPLVLKAGGQLLHHLLALHLASPHLRLARLRVRKDPHQAVVAHPGQAQPGQVPAAVALRVGKHAAMGFRNNVRTERIVPRKAAELHE